MKAAFYGRYSSDSQRETSIDDQRRIVLRWADRFGHEIVSEFSDAAVSGDSACLREGLQRMLDAALSGSAPFEAIAVDQLSRLSRDVGDTDSIIKRLRFKGIRVVAVSDGIDTTEETAKVNVTVKSLVNELYLDDLRKTTKRGLDGQFLKGFATGGRLYGYATEPVHDPSGRTGPRGEPVPIGYRTKIVPEEAGQVRRIFALFAEGNGEKAIARELNAGGSGRPWRANTIFSRLRNAKYNGHFFFNQREWFKNPQTGKRVYRRRPRDQWEHRYDADLMIVDDATWNAVQERLNTRRHMFSKKRTAARHLLSGLLVCPDCGGRYSIVGRHYYGCRNNRESGTCGNDISVNRESLEHLVVGRLAAELPALVDRLVDAAAERNVRAARRGNGETRSRARARKREAEALLKAVQKGTLKGRALEEGMKAYQRIWDEVQAMEKSLEDQEPGRPRAVTVSYSRSAALDFFAHLPEFLRGNPEAGREFLREIVREIRISNEGRKGKGCPACGDPVGALVPQHLKKHGLTRAECLQIYPGAGFTKKARLEIEPNPEGILGAGKVFGLVVAGAGFEPAAFGL
jgi:DNA invertase Pin-like site-specific DNA recombinase